MTGNILVLLFELCVFLFFISLSFTVVNCQRVEFSMFCQVVKFYIFVVFFGSCLKYIIWPIFVFN